MYVLCGKTNQTKPPRYPIGGEEKRENIRLSERGRPAEVYLRPVIPTAFILSQHKHPDNGTLDGNNPCA